MVRVPVFYQKVMNSNPSRSNEVFFREKNINRGALCLGGHTKKYGSGEQPSHIKIPPV